MKNPQTIQYHQKEKIGGNSTWKLTLLSTGLHLYLSFQLHFVLRGARITAVCKQSFPIWIIAGMCVWSMVKITSVQNANAPSTLKQRSLEFLIKELVMIIWGMILCGNGTMIQQCIEELWLLVDMHRCLSRDWDYDQQQRWCAKMMISSDDQLKMSRNSWAAVSSGTKELMGWAEKMSSFDMSEISCWLHEFTVL